jgi:hypothetical protein
MKWCVLVWCIVLGGNEFAHANFFENSRRRDALASEKAYMARVERCVGFFVRNSQRKNYLVTARHCLPNADADAWCRKRSSVTDYVTGKSHRCVRKIAGDGLHDPVVFEVDGKLVRSTLRIGERLPSKDTFLKLVGKPGDKYASGKVMVSENCWFTSGDHPTPHTHGEWYEKGLRDLSFKYNCSVYGGNSGGPVIIEGTDIAIGLPYNYGKDEFENKSPDQTSDVAQLTSFSSDFKHELRNAGITVTDRISGSRGIKSPYLKSAYYYSADIPGCKFAVLAKYLTVSWIVELDVTYSGESCNGHDVYKCTNGLCKSERNTTIQQVARTQCFTYRNKTTGGYAKYCP